MSPIKASLSPGHRTSAWSPLADTSLSLVCVLERGFDQLNAVYSGDYMLKATDIHPRIMGFIAFLGGCGTRGARSRVLGKGPKMVSSFLPALGFFVVLN